MSKLPGNILAATDFSETAERANDFARELSRTFQAQLHLLHVIVILDDPHIEENLRHRLEELVASGDEARRRDLENGANDQPGFEVTPHMVRGLAPAEVIVETASNLGCELIVMGTHGRKGLSHLLLGSVAERVVRTSKVPVLTVRANADIELPEVPKILVPHDFSEASATAVQQAAVWADALGAEITLLHVVEPVVYPEFYSVDVLSDDLMERLVERSERALGKAAEDLLGGTNARVQVEVGRAANTIVDYADPGRYDAVVMATRGLSGLEQVLIGSVAESVLRRCEIPLLAVPSSQSDD
jgi:nucleotide-binding universal stress UspA family protein